MSLFLETLWLSKVLEDPTGYNDPTPPAPDSKHVENDPTLASPPLPSIKGKEGHQPPLKKAKSGKGKAHTSQGSQHPEEIVRRKYPTRRSQGTPIDVESHPASFSTTKFFGEIVSAQDCDRLISLPSDQQEHQTGSHFA